MKKILIAVVILALAGGGFTFWKQHKKAALKKQEASSLITVSKGDIEETVEATGEVTPLNRVEIKPPISGRIEELLIDEGSSVKGGQIIAWMSSSDRAAIMDAARAKGPDEVAKWKDTYNPTPIMAPLSGVIIARNVVVGQTVDASTILFAMSDRLIVNAQVDEADIGRVKLNLPARITLDAYPGQDVNGKVFQILYEGKNVSNVIKYGVKISPDKVPAFFRSQMTANVTLVLQHRDDALLLPSAAIRDTPEGKMVMMPNPEGGRPNLVPVETGLTSGGQTEIRSGLKEGDQILMVRARYTQQKGVQTSPLTMGGNSNRQRTSGASNGGGSNSR